MDKKGYYKLLNTTKDATTDEIKIAFRIKAKELHPDKNKNFDTTEQFKQLNEAYMVLSDEKKRQEYDSHASIFLEINFPRDNISESDFKQYDISMDKLTCSCDDWVDNRSKYPNYDPRKLCKHLVYKLFSTDLPEEFKPFKDYLEYRKSTFRGVKLFQEIVFLKSSIVVIDYYGTHIFLYLKKQVDDFCSYKVFEVHRYKGIGYKWMIIPDSLNDGKILYWDKIDGKDYINKRFNVINADVPLCNRLYKRFKEEEKYCQEKEKYCQAQKYKEKYCRTTTKLLQQFESHYTTRTFNEKLKMMGYLVKFKELNNNMLIVKDDGLKYGINYCVEDYTSYYTNNETSASDLPDWYVFTTFDYETMSYQKNVQCKSIRETDIMWEKKKFNQLLEIMDKYVEPPKPPKPKKEVKKREREWVKYVSCHHCGSKNIHKKNKRVYGYGTVQRYQCMDCKSIFQEQIYEDALEEKNKDGVY